MSNCEKSTSAATPPEASCVTCQNWMIKTKGDKDDIKTMSRAGFARCELGPRWEFLPPMQTCERHKPVAADVAAVRVAWANKG